MAQLYECDLCQDTIRDEARFQVSMEVVLPGGMRYAQLNAGLPVSGNLRRAMDLCADCAAKFTPIKALLPQLNAPEPEPDLLDDEADEVS